MTDYRETIRLNSLGFSNRNTISEVLAYAEKHSISWPIPEALTNMKLIFMHMIFMVALYEFFARTISKLA